MIKRFIYCEDCLKVVRIDQDQCIHYSPPERNAESVTVIFRGPDGKVSIPWEPGAKCPKGFVREEVRGAHAVRRLEREMDSKDRARFHQNQEKMERMMEPINSSVREGLKHQMRNAKHPFEKELAQAALQRMERGYSKNYDPGNHRS